MDVPERHPTRTPARMSQTRSAGPGRPHAAAAPSQCHWCPPCRCPETPPDTLRASRPAKIHLRWQNSCRICSHFQMPFSAAVSTVRHPACCLPRSPSAGSLLHPLVPSASLFFYIIAQVPPSVVCHSRTKQPVSRRLRQIFVCFRGCYDCNAGKVVEPENEVTAVRIDFVAQYGYNIIRILLL